MKRSTLALLLSLLAATASAQEEVLVGRGSTMRWLANATDPGLGLSWVDEGFDDGTWTLGVYGAGYETGTGALDLLDTIVPEDSLSLYTRAEFTIDDPLLVSNLLIAADWDDGWAAWINGVEVHRSPEMPGGDPAWDARPALHESSNASAPVYSPVIDLTPLAAGVLRAGRNVLALGVWNSNSGSSDLVLVPQLVRDRPTDIVRGPYLQLPRPDAVLLRWRTGGPTPSRVFHGPPADPRARVAEDARPSLEHELLLDGLPAGVEWRYEIEGEGRAHAFRTPVEPGVAAPLRIWAIGDSGTGDANARAVRDAYAALHGPSETDTWLLLGDNAYEDGSDADYQAGFFDVYGDMMASVAAWPTLGNHDGRSAVSASESGPYYDIFSLPRAAEAGGIPSGTEAYYSFDQANAHFVCLDSFDSDRSAGGDMLTWLQADLAASSQTWLIAYWHHPPYSKGSHDSDTGAELIEMRENAVPILEAAGVDLVLSGHSHSYERSVLLDDHLGDSASFGPGVVVDAGDGNIAGDGEYAKPSPGLAPHEGAVYAVAGSSAKTASAPLDHPAMVVSLERLGSVIVELRGLRLDLSFLDETGLVRDAFTIVKGCAAAPCVESDCSNGLDDDGDGAVDEEDSDCAPPDSDGDGREDVLDCAPMDASVWATPPSPAPLFVAAPDARLSWSDTAAAAGPGTVHDVLGGLVSELRADGSLARAECIGSAVSGGGLVHVASNPDDARWYLVRAENACGRSSLGDSGLGPRSLPVEPCP